MIYNYPPQQNISVISSFPGGSTITKTSNGNVQQIRYITEKISELFEGFNIVCAYVGDVLVRTKYKFTDNIKELVKVLQKSDESGL